MISYLKGELVAKQPPTLLLESGGIGYTIEASMQTFYRLPESGTAILLHIQLLIKEEKPVLYGFIDSEERKLFQELIKINTIGPKAALAILSNIELHQLVQIVTHQDVKALQHIPGIGRKTAERLLLELTNRLMYWKPAAIAEQTTNTSDLKNDTSYIIQQDAISALIALGYKPQMAAQVVRSLINPTVTTEQLIRLALTQLMKS